MLNILIVKDACVSCSNPLQQAADGIRQALGEEVVNCAEMAGYVDTLLASPGPFDERKLGGGPWQVHP